MHMVTTVILSIAGFIVIFVGVEGWTVRIPRDRHALTLYTVLYCVFELRRMLEIRFENLILSLEQFALLLP